MCPKDDNYSPLIVYGNRVRTDLSNDELAFSVIEIVLRDFEVELARQNIRA